MTTIKDDQRMDEMVSSSDSYDNELDSYQDDGFFDRLVYYKDLSGRGHGAGISKSKCTVCKVYNICGWYFLQAMLQCFI